MLFVLYLQQDKTKEALPYLDYAIANNEQHLNLEPVKALLMQVLQLQQVAAKDPGNVDVMNEIASTYFKMGNKTGAALYIEKALQTAPGNKAALALQSQLKKV
jgi:Tfp pilus assembly protein PilF